MGLLSIAVNKMLPKFTLKLSNGTKEKFNSVMALKMRTKQLQEQGIDYEFRENW